MINWVVARCNHGSLVLQWKDSDFRLPGIFYHAPSLWFLPFAPLIFEAWRNWGFFIMKCDIWQASRLCLGGRLTIMYFIRSQESQLEILFSPSCYLHLEESFHPPLLQRQESHMRLKLHVLLAYFCSLFLLCSLVCRW